MKNLNISKCVEYIVIFFLFTFQLTFGQDNKPGFITRPESLRGIEKLNVLVVSSYEGRGINTEKLKTHIELKLRLAGIKISSDTQNTLFCALNIKEIEVGKIGDQQHYGYFYYNGLQLSQYCLTLKPGDPGIVNAITWYNSSVGTGSQYKIKEKIDSSIDDLVEDFMNDYLKYN
tara:strand:- start:367 stop:888 length:522 start_codon:yes stop_codon:yes gene_type:complete